jgi:hypothetical protein
VPELLIGYVIGTLQILVLDWARTRAQHRRHLRALRAELRRLSEYATEFVISDDRRIDSDKIPHPPQLNPQFSDLVFQTEFFLTDEIRDDNSQEALLDIEAGCRSLDYYWKDFDRRIQHIKSLPPGPERAERKAEAVDVAESYNRTSRMLQLSLRSTMDDMDRRLRASGTTSQLKRLFTRLPPRENPPRIALDDPRLDLPRGGLPG